MLGRERKKPGPKPKPPEEKVPRRGIQPPGTQICTNEKCKGVGWYRDKNGKKRTCRKCKGTGRVPKK